MAEEKEKKSLLRSILSSLFGLFSGAVLMYVSPLVNSAIKPPRPVPNFAYTAESTQVTFNNRSTGGTQGWWDFGDGSALEPFSPGQGTLVHRYPAPGTYPVKLSLNNLIGEESERTVAVRVEAGGSPQPAIEDLQVQLQTLSPARLREDGAPVAPAPATFQLVARVKNAEWALWSIDDQPLEFVEATAGTLKHTVTFTYYGPKKIRLMAVNGRHRVEKAADVWVDVPDEDPRILIYPTAVSFRTESEPFSVSIPAAFKGPSYPFELNRSVSPDAVILDAYIDQKPSAQLVRDPQLVIASDRRSFQVRGQLLRAGSQGVSPSWYGKVELKVANRNALPTPQAAPVVGKLNLPGRTVLNLPAAAGAQAGVLWEVRQGMDVLMKDTKVPVTQLVPMGKQRYRVVVREEGGRIVVDAAEAAAPPLVNTSTVRPVPQR